MFMHQGTGRLTAAAALALALAGAGMNSAMAAPGDAASAPEGASMSYAAGSQYTVRPGQSLNDVAIAVTQSRDKGTLARASRALFDANPNAFMSHDPSRMRVGALLTIPALDASGALAASAPVAGSASAAPSAAPVTSASVPNAAAAGAVVGAASSVAQVNAAAASAASAAARAAAPATAAVSEAGSSTVGAGPVAPGSSTAAGTVPAAPAAGSQAAAALPGSGAHVWSGAIQPSASEAAEGASAATAAAPATAAAQSASQPRAQVSSLQQLLALKNRVLMELQKHGIGGSPAAPVKPSTNAVQPATGASSAAAVSSNGAVPTSTSNDIGISQTNLSIAAAIGAALVVLLAAFRMRRRKRVAVAATEGTLAADAAAAAARAAELHEAGSTHEPTPVPEASDAGGEAAEGYAVTLTQADREAAEGDAAARETAERVAAERAAEIRAAAEREAAERERAEQAATVRADQTRATAEREAAEQAAAEHEAVGRQLHTDLPAQDPNAPQHVLQESHPAPTPIEPGEQRNPELTSAAQGGPTVELLPAAHHENLDGATTAASLAAAAELGADALPRTPLEPVNDTFPEEVPPHRLQWDDEPASSVPQAEPKNDVPADSPHPLGTPAPVIDFTQQQVEPHTTSPFGNPLVETQPQPTQPAETATPHEASHAEPAPVAQVPHALSVPAEFPRDAVDAFSSLDMPLPPRIELPDAALSTPESLATQPVASPESTAQQAVAPHDPDDAPHAADEISAGTAGHAAVAGLGAVGFGALKLDFDLELPPSPAQPLPVFTSADLTRIARNKLDLAAEYIDLGDLSGARVLINEVIEANDPATRTEARALLSTLAPLS
ncbi:FimV/HubP family polar landmark protein [Paraburkholderia agricolaris]|uniref:FimV/HubP family polar landmark protein n=1 Tax=Paraburkholderia agricolaris TaxID=2152888 RepID=UPI003CCE2838